MEVKTKKKRGHPARGYEIKALFKRVPKELFTDCNNAVDNLIREWKRTY